MTPADIHDRINRFVSSHPNLYSLVFPRGHGDYTHSDFVEHVGDRLDTLFNLFWQAHNIRKAKKIRPLFEEWKQTVTDNLITLAQEKNWNQQSYMHLHQLLYPAGIIADERSHWWDAYYGLHDAWVYRTGNLFFQTKHAKYHYPDMSQIPEYMDAFWDFWDHTDLDTLTPEEIFPLVIASFGILCEIHPFPNGNGSVNQLFFQSVLKAYDMSWSITQWYASLRVSEQIDFFKTLSQWSPEETPVIIRM